MLLFSIICAVIQVILWWLYQYDAVKNLVNKIFGNYGDHINRLLLSCIEVLPCILVIQYRSDLALFFLLGSLVADKFMDDSFPVGGTLFLATYGLTALTVIFGYPFNPLYWVCSVTTILICMIIVFNVLKTGIIEKIAEGVYGFTALVLLMTAFFHTHNFGFLFLVIGDVTLIVKDIFKGTKAEKLIMTVSNSFYYCGLCFVPLTLIIPC